VTGSLTSPPSALPPAVFTDLSSLSALKANAGDKTEEAAQLKEAARQFSSIFLHMAVKSMRDASFGGGILDSQQSEFYRDMFDQQLTLELSSGEGFGLTQLIVDQLSPNIDSIPVDEEAILKVSTDKAATYTQIAETPHSPENKEIDSVSNDGVNLRDGAGPRALR